MHASGQGQLLVRVPVRALLGRCCLGLGPQMAVGLWLRDGQVRPERAVVVHLLRLPVEATAPLLLRGERLWAQLDADLLPG